MSDNGGDRFVGPPATENPWPKLEDWRPDIVTAIQIMAAQNLAKAVKAIEDQILEDLNEHKIFEDSDAYNAVYGYRTALEAALIASGIKYD